MMATFDYSKMLLRATVLLQRYGAAATVTHRSAGTYDPTTGTATVVTATTTVTAVVLDMPLMAVNGDTVLQGDALAYVSAADALPKPMSKFNWHGDDYNIITAKAISPSGTPVLYELQIRK